MESKQHRTESEIKCINKVKEVVSEYFRGEFIEFPQRIDNGFDGVIVWRENGNVIDVIYVQCKGGQSYFPKNISSKFRVQNMTKENVKKHKKVWESVIGPAIMVITNSQKKAWWIDLKSKDSYDDEGEVLYCNPNNLFKSSAKKDISNLIKKQIDKNSIPNLHVYNNKLPNFLVNKSLKEVSRNMYKELGKEKITSLCKDLDKKIEFTRVGWRHITRKKRNKERVIQSLILLPLARDIIEKATEFEKIDAEYKKDKKSGNKVIVDKLVIKAQCSFHYRFPAIIKVVLLRKREITSNGIEERIWFYSIYEARRKQNLEVLVR
ncbi:DUF4365 domain-containing protein [Clostridium perfringens]|uniref:DUF4365 domain-containing protein n=1 Tax=Clostridium perfringens TaxID=1502 RepID=UPI000DF1052D|nr:DUF4365 domain-containing protein [Clostridium perfringens]STB42738.1 Uncharacterised protein [Clostridium perfringens]